MYIVLWWCGCSANSLNRAYIEEVFDFIIVDMILVLPSRAEIMTIKKHTFRASGPVNVIPMPDIIELNVSSNDGYKVISSCSTTQS